MNSPADLSPWTARASVSRPAPGSPVISRFSRLFVALCMRSRTPAIDAEVAKILGVTVAITGEPLLDKYDGKTAITFGIRFDAIEFVPGKIDQPPIGRPTRARIVRHRRQSAG